MWLECWAQYCSYSNTFLKALFRGNFVLFVNNANLGAIAHTSNGTYIFIVYRKKSVVILITPSWWGDLVWGETTIWLTLVLRSTLDVVCSFYIFLVVISASFGASRRLFFVIVAFPGYLYLYFCWGLWLLAAGHRLYYLPLFGYPSGQSLHCLQTV